MRFLYATAILATLTASAQAFSAGSPVCKSDDATLQSVAKAAKMGKQADATAFAGTWGFTLWDENAKEVTGTSVMTNMQYSVTVKGGPYNGVMTYPMLDGARVPVANEAKSFSLEPGSNTFQNAKCAATDGATITHTTADSKDAKAVVAKFTLMDGGNAKKFMMSGIVVTAKSTFGKAVSQSFDITQGTNTGNNTDNTGGNNGNTDNTGGGTTNGGSPTDNTGGNTGSGSNTTDTTGANSASFVRPAIALQLIALAAFLLA